MTFLPTSFHRFRDAVRRGDVSRGAGRFQDAIEAYTEAMVLRGDDLTPDQETDLRIRIADNYLELGDVESADLVLAPTNKLDDRRVLPSTAGMLRVVRARIAFYRGDYESTVDWADRAWEYLRSTGENSNVARALTLRGHGRRRQGQLQEAHDDYTDAMAAARRAGDDHQVGLAASNLGFLLWQSGRYHEARRLHERAARIHEESGSEAQLTRELFALSVDEFHCGRWAKVDALLTRCGERAARSEDRRMESALEIARGRLELHRGQDPRGSLEKARTIADSAGYGYDLVVIAQIAADAAVERGDLADAHRILRDAADHATKAAPNGEPAVDTVWRLAVVEDLLEITDPRETLEEALEKAQSRELHATEAFVRRALGQILLRRGELDGAREHLESSLSIFRELRIPYEIGRSLIALGQLLAETRTDAVRAPSLFREAEALLEEIGAERAAKRAADALAVSSGEKIHEVAKSDADVDSFTPIATRSNVMVQAIERARQIAPSDLPVLITGETGTGKELFSRAIHGASERQGAPFFAVNCAALSETLLEAELFGHVKGAFTGAVSGKAGIFEAAHGGTVFLDEVAKAPLSLQAKLLRVLDTGEVRRVGGVEPIHVNVRILAATNRALPELVERGEFLPDLLYRLRGFEISIAPLRDRAEDVVFLFERFAGRAITSSAKATLQAYDWPGNVRELRNLAESVSFLTLGSGPIPQDALPDWIRNHRREVRIMPLVDNERALLEQALEEAGGNRSRAAKALGISRQTLYTKMTKLGIGRASAA